MSDGILQPDQPIKFQARNHRPFYKRLRAGDFYGGNLEYDKETWEMLKTIPDDAIIEIILYYHDGDAPVEEKADEQSPAPTREKKAEKERGPKLSGPFGLYWRQMVIAQFWNVPGVWQLLCPNDDMPVDKEEAEEMAAKALREIFIVNTRADIAPIELEAWANEHGLESLITLSRNALVKSQEQS